MFLFCESQSFMNKLTECLAEEYHSSGITFCTLPIWIVSTNMTHNLGRDLWVPSPEKYVQSALETIKYQESFETTGYWPHTIIKLGWQSLTLLVSPRLLGRGMNWYFNKMRKYFRMMEESGDRKKKRLNLLKVLKANF